MELSGQVAIVTGAGRGIGRATALELAGLGADIVVAELDQAGAERTAAEVKGLGRRVSAVRTDVTSRADLKAMAERARAEFGRIDILVNNAGGSRRFTLETTEAQWEEALTLNFTRHRQLTQRILPQMIERKWGRIINITGKSEPEGINGAFAAKAAVHSWAKGLSREVGKHGITVNSVPPGRIISEQILRNYSPEFRERESREDIPVGEYGQPEDIAHLVCFLASPRARYITGAVIPVDGGLRRYQF